ncbi:transglutaminase domain-containing protein [Spongiactinospora sp. TRM90649]|uniref:transglutaminase domain-containing protein n=1 Tax=Spongiactinospora sp. TRM90649 TaxID=3031114 RepID=UPI0023F620C4|nr:transglutaminase domain-containing protein [Spongiactinospora sp. TRM90649]MDF5757113.1 transglutaminase domain-containing protein [Spongiactinospora sp. TRM90649]
MKPIPPPPRAKGSLAATPILNRRHPRVLTLISEVRTLPPAPGTGKATAEPGEPRDAGPASGEPAIPTAAPGEALDSGPATDEAVTRVGAASRVDAPTGGDVADRGTVADLDILALLATAHRLIATRVRPVYAMNERQPVSMTLALGRGSCSQRLALLEAVARGLGTPTRVRGLLVDGRFWNPRFPRLRRLIPRRVVLAWPEFRLHDRWVPASELFGDLRDLRSASPFTNTGGETLFDAIARTAIDWDGVTCSSCDLSGHVLADLGHFASRDALFDEHGQTLCLPIRVPVDCVMRHRAALVDT